MFTFGFSYVGLIFLLMLFVPNIIWTKNKPQDYERYVIYESRVLGVFEKVGEALTTCCALVFSDFNIRRTPWAAWLAAAFVLMVMYEIYWVRYFKSERTMKDFYSSLCGVPVAGATLPVCAFLLLGIYGSNVLMIVSAVILGIGHIGIHLAHRRRACGKKERGVLSALLRFVAAVVAVILLAFAIVVTGGRNYNYIEHYRNIIAGGVDEEAYVTLGGQEQYLLIRGKNVDNPVMIYLHGGPSSPDTYCTYSFSDGLTDAYTFIAWDQRGCGRTYFRNIKNDPQNKTATFEQALTDLDELVDYARERFGRDKVTIMGHSYGTILGGTYALQHPEKVECYFGIGQVVSLEQSDVYSYNDALAKAEKAGDDTTEMVAAFSKCSEPHKLSDLMALRQLVSKYHPSGAPDKSTIFAVFSPYFGIDDMRFFLRQLGDMDDYYALNKQLFDYALSADMRDAGMEYEMPVYFISGSRDWICPTDTTHDYFDEITAEFKSFFMMGGCGHTPQYVDPEQFDKMVFGVQSRDPEVLAELVQYNAE